MTAAAQSHLDTENGPDTSVVLVELDHLVTGALGTGQASAHALHSGKAHTSRTHSGYEKQMSAVAAIREFQVNQPAQGWQEGHQSANASAHH